MKAAVLAAAIMIGALAGANPTSRASLVGIAYFRQQVVSVSKTQAFPGSTQAWSSKVILLHSPTVAGSGGIGCIYTTNTLRECFGTYRLPQGNIKVQGELTDRVTFTLGIIGGTGVYENTHGVASVSPGLVTFYFS